MELSERQSEIIEKAITIIDKKGIQGLTIKNLSKEIGISEAAIYRHFKSKTDIQLAVISSFDDLSKMFSEIMSSFEGTAYDKIHFMFDKMIGVFTSNPAIVSVFFSEEIFRNEAVLKSKVISIQNRNQRTIEGIINTGIENNEIRNDVEVKSLSIIIMGSIRLLVKSWNLNQFSFSLKQEGKVLITSINALLSK